MMNRRSTMFWKKTTEKKQSPKEILISKIEQLSGGQGIRYRLPETYGGGLAVLGLNPEYDPAQPKKGKKYVMAIETLVNDKPSGKKRVLWDTAKPKDLANWVFERNGELYE